MTAPVTLERPETPYVPRWLRGWALALVGLVALAIIGVAAWSWSRPDPVAAEEAARAATAVAERAVVPVVSYDYRNLADDRAEAESWLTPSYRDGTFAPLWATVAKNAPAAKTVITAKVVASGVVHATPDRVQVLVLVDRPTSNADSPTPVTYEDHVTLTMVKRGGQWLIDNLVTQ